MGRSAKYTAEQFVDAALELVADRGPSAVTISAVAGKLRAPVGSVYHRFTSRDVLLAKLWLRTVRSFQLGFLDALRRGDGLEAALYTLQWVRAHPKEGKLLLLYRREELVSGPWPQEIQSVAADLTAELDSAIKDFTQHLFAEVSKETLLRTVFALVDVPYAAVRRSLLAGESPPIELDDLVSTTYQSILGSLP
ncbi:MAG: TetR/AcrR family transcriptional regulator [Thermodesulfobacteriota bacterium]